MDPIEDAGLDPDQRAVVIAALAADPALAADLELIDSQLADGARWHFWRAFAIELRDRARPAAAVLAALERATRRSTDRRSGGGGGGRFDGVSRGEPGAPPGPDRPKE